MKAYEKIGWLDHVQDIETGEVIQEGTPVSQVNMNHMDEGIFTNREAFILHEAQIADAQKEITVGIFKRNNIQLVIISSGASDNHIELGLAMVVSAFTFAAFIIFFSFTKVYTTRIPIPRYLILKNPVRFSPPLFPNGFPKPSGAGSGDCDTFQIPERTCFLTLPSSLSYCFIASFVICISHLMPDPHFLKVSPTLLQ